MEERKPVILEETDSTNRWLKEAAVKGAPDGTVVIARRQTSGRGRFDRSFSSPEGGLYYSQLKRNFPGGDDLVKITQLVAVAVRRAIIESTGAEPQIKWINDLYLQGKKICGILCESVSIGPENHIIVGIGINVNTRPEDLPGELQDKAGSLAQICGRGLDTDAVAAALTRQLDKLLADPKALENEYSKEYRKYCYNFPEDMIIKQEE
jgi:BirA family biotin operon repressor/biotin-[acetyl-CoA-carboxylase] ligase